MALQYQRIASRGYIKRAESASIHVLEMKVER
jgi:hypothetical protein